MLKSSSWGEEEEEGGGKQKGVGEGSQRERLLQNIYCAPSTLQNALHCPHSDSGPPSQLIDEEAIPESSGLLNLAVQQEEGAEPSSSPESTA